MENTFFDLKTMTPKDGCIIERCTILDTTRALAIIDFHMYLVTTSANEKTFYYCSNMHRIVNSYYYNGHYIVQFQNNTSTWYCPYLHSKGYPSRHQSIDRFKATIDRLMK